MLFLVFVLFFVVLYGVSRLLKERFTIRIGMLLGALLGFASIALIYSPCIVDTSSNSCFESIMGLHFMTLMIPALIFDNISFLFNTDNFSTQYVIAGSAFIIYIAIGSGIGYLVSRANTRT